MANKLAEDYIREFKTLDNDKLKKEYLRLSKAMKEDSDEEDLLEKVDYVMKQIALNVIYG